MGKRTERSERGSEFIVAYIEDFLADIIIHADVVKIVLADKACVAGIYFYGAVRHCYGVSAHGDIGRDIFAQTVAGCDESSGPRIDRKRLKIGAVENYDIFFVLTAEYVRFCLDIILHCDVMIEVFLIQIKHHADVGRVPDEFKLVAAHFKYY